MNYRKRKNVLHVADLQDDIIDVIDVIDIIDNREIADENLFDASTGIVYFNFLTLFLFFSSCLPFNSDY